MKLDRNDVVAVAKSRVNRAEGNKLSYYAVAWLVCTLGGMYVTDINTIVGWLVIVAGVILFFRYVRILNKKQNILKAQLFKEWEAESK